MAGPTMRLARVHHPVTALGPGIRTGIWFQGCTIGCAGCLSRDTWPADPNATVTIDEVVTWVLARAEAGTTGLTISGGEPSEQPEALAALLGGLREPCLEYGWDVLCYTGVEEDEFARRCPSAYATIDVLVTGPYRASEPTNLIWRGSANQNMVLLTELGRTRYGDFVAATSTRPPLQVQFDGGGVFVIGVPRTGDLARLDRMLSARGIALSGVSWRPDPAGFSRPEDEAGPSRPGDGASPSRPEGAP